MQDPDGARYEEAYREFKTAYASSPSWKILGNLGICAMKLERDGEAIEAFDKYLTQGGADVDGAERGQFERDLQTLRTGVVMVTLQSVPTGARRYQQGYHRGRPERGSVPEQPAHQVPCATRPF
jgi:hypothetical protein